MFNNIYKNKKVLVTGHTGFKGSWLVNWLSELGANVIGVSDIVNTQPSHFSLLESKIEKSILVDIRNYREIVKIIESYKPEIVFHLAAQALVKSSYHDPILTYETNVIGTLNLLQSCRNNKVKAFLNITTDKVYENKEWIYPYRENDELGGYDMYSSSKACSEILTQSFRRSFLKEEGSMLLASVRAGNVIGGGDWADNRIIPDIVRAASTGNITEIRSPLAIRPWQHVLEPLSGYLVVGENLLNGNSKHATSFNFGPNKELVLTVKELIEECGNCWDKIRYELKENNDFHEANILKLDCTKSNSKLGWKPVWNAETTIHKTIGWYKAYYEEGELLTNKDLAAYTSDAKRMKLNWA